MQATIEVLPHQAFRLDFDQIVMEGKRQEEIHPANKGEYAIVKSMHRYFSFRILPCIVQSDWVYKAATTFAAEYATGCFHHLRRMGQVVYKTQQELHDINKRVTDCLVRAYCAGFAPLAGTVELAKASDFIELVEVERLDPGLRAEALSLHEESRAHEDFQLTVTLQAVRDSYEMNIPRIMFVVRRAMKVELDLSEKKSDDKLLSPSDYIDWYLAHADDSHPLYPVLGKGNRFYKAARNVGSHHVGLEWQPGKDTVILNDRGDTLTIHVHRFQQWFRYLVHFSDLGVRGILAAFCEREWGPVSMNVAKQYDRTFPPDWEGATARVVVPYAV